MDVIYTNGVIAARETGLLGGKIYKFCEMSADEAFRAVLESGFARGAEADSVFGYEKLLAADESDIDAFIRQYAPTDAEKSYFLSPRDFHNAKAVIKTLYAQADGDKLFAPEGLIPVEEIIRCIKEEDYAPLGEQLGEACKKAAELFGEENSEVTGAEIGSIFEKYMYKHLSAVCRRNSTLKKLLQKKADYTNILTAFRSKTPEYAANTYVFGGKLKYEQLEKLFSEDFEKAENAFKNTDCYEFVKTCFEAKKNNLPYTGSERILSDTEIDFLAEKKYELKNTQPFLYYVLRRRAENLNLRILFVCLMAGMDENDIKKRLRKV